MLTGFNDLFEEFYFNRMREIELSLEGNEEYRENNKDFQETLTRIREEQNKAPQELSILNALKHFIRNISRISIREGYKQGFNDALKIMRGF